VIRIVIAENDHLIREGLKLIVEQDKEIEVVDCASNGFEAFELCEKLLPDLVLMDFSMPECDGIEGTKLIKAKYDIKVLILTISFEQDTVSKALNSGADGYTLKDIKPLELVQLIKSTIGGLQVIHKNVFSKMMQQDMKHIEIPPVNVIEKGTSIIHLTNREKSVLNLVICGKSNKEIAANLMLSEGRVRNIITSMFKKSGLEDRTQLAIYAFKNNIV
jgi:DNA-binding NarL/FixJ family response regulator